MLEFVTYSADKVQALALISFRAAGLFISAPILNSSAVPFMVKAGVALTLGIMLVPTVSQALPAPVDSIWLLAILAIKEILVGFIIGFFFSTLFYGIRMAGGIIGYQSGLMMAEIMDPESGSSETVVSEFWWILGALIFLTINGHHAIFSAFADSFKVLSIGGLTLTGPAGEAIIKFTAYSFVIAIKVAAPVLITLFLVTTALGVIARTVPQMNIFVIGIPLKIAVAFAIMAVSLPLFRIIVDQSVYYLDGQVLGLVAALGQI